MRKKILFLGIFLGIAVFVSLVFAVPANIVLKLVATNPSKGQMQKVLLKAYLPVEIKPEDIVDKADLDVAYDTQQGSYYVFREYDIKPGEFLERDVEIKNIWAIDNKDIASLRSEAVKLEGLLKKTEYAERIAFLKDSIDSRLNQVAESQLNPPSNPERHISLYRDNLKIMEAVKADMALARTLLAQMKTTLPTVTVWRLLLLIISFLGILGVSFYVVWQRQLKVITAAEDTFAAAAAKPELDAQRHEAKQEKKTEASDIEKIIKDET